MTLRKRIIHGFTLIEIAVVLVLVGLLASAVALASGGMIGGATEEEVVAQVGSIDTEARRLAKYEGRAIELHIDRDTQKLVLRDPQIPSSPPLGSIAFPRSYEIQNAWHWSRGEQIRQSQIVVRYKPDGTSSTWGLTLAAAGGGKDSRTLLILGVTGQMSLWENDEQAEDILAATHGHHTD